MDTFFFYLCSSRRYVRVIFGDDWDNPQDFSITRNGRQDLTPLHRSENIGVQVVSNLLPMDTSHTSDPIRRKQSTPVGVSPDSRLSDRRPSCGS